MNYYFKKCEGTYEQNFDNLLADGAISTRGLKDDAKIVDEFIFDVNTEYFEINGGYKYAKKFYEEAYHLAVKEVGNEDYILSAVLHADEKNTALSQKLGRDVYHYHLHVVYIPVVEKEVYFKKNNKNPELAGKLKEVIHQVSHSKKWPREIQLDENGEPVKSKNGKTVLINSYSLLQDRFYNHMREVGYDGFERGERGSITEHLDVLDYKIQQDRKELNDISEQNERKQKEADKLIQATKVLKNISATHDEINKMTKPSKSGNNVFIANDDWKRVSDMAKRCTLLDEKMTDLNKQIKNLQQERDTWKNNYTRLWEEVKDFIYAIRRFPSRLLDFIKEQLHMNPAQHKNKSHEL